MTRKFIRKDDNTDHNGVVLDGVPGSSLLGKPMADVGASVMCNTCNTQGVIVSDGSPHTVTAMGKIVAIEGDLCACQCEPMPRLIASQETGGLSA